MLTYSWILSFSALRTLLLLLFSNVVFSLVTEQLLSLFIHHGAIPTGRGLSFLFNFRFLQVFVFLKPVHLHSLDQRLSLVLCGLLHAWSLRLHDELLLLLLLELELPLLGSSSHMQFVIE